MVRCARTLGPMFLPLLILAWIATVPCFANSEDVTAETTGILDDNCKTIIAGRIVPNQMIGESAVMASIKGDIAKLANSHIPVLIVGETGTGKEVVANGLYSQGDTKGPFVIVNMAAVPEPLAEGLFFGSEKGSFTGSAKQHKGHFEAASGGTIFLDEIGEMPLSMQAKLLRVLDGYGFSRVGSSEVIRPKFRLIAATNRNLAEMVRDKLFREDLYHRLQVVTIHLPPLRDRKQDIPALAQHLLDQIRLSEPGLGPAERFSEGALIKLMDQKWPGNIRELRTAVTRAYIAAAQEEIQAEEIVFFDSLRGGHEHSALVRQVDQALAGADVHAMREAIRALDRVRFQTAVTKCRSQAEAAALLGVSMTVFRRLAREYEIKI
jgi:DNA-binding NtrC family response regulator